MKIEHLLKRTFFSLFLMQLFSGCGDTCCENSSMNNESLPIACTLSDPELAERRSAFLKVVQKSLVEKKELATGFAFRFKPDVDLNQLIHLINLERECCQFLNFTLKISENNGPIWLELKGPEGTKELLQNIL